MFDNKRSENRDNILYFKSGNSLLNIDSLVEVNEVISLVPSN